LPPRRVYWDSCTFLGLIKEEPERVSDCLVVWRECEENRTLIVTSFFTFTEVIKVKCGAPAQAISDEDDQRIEQMLRQAWIQPAVLDRAIAIAARRAMRQYPQCKKPSDAIHLATACALNVEEMHTFDGSDLLNLDGKVMRADRQLLTICKPRKAPDPPESPTGPEVGQTADWLNNGG
jgi:predicted nucleic acid-binding protein